MNNILKLQKCEYRIKGIWHKGIAHMKEFGLYDVYSIYNLKMNKVDNVEDYILITLEPCSLMQVSDSN